MYNYDKVKEGIKLILEGIGEDINREGLLETPDRIARMYEDIFSSVNKDGDEILAKQFEIDNKNIVIEKNITFFSMCEHHLLPFYGEVSIAYIPNCKVVGLSKLARIVDFYSRKPQIQERFTEEIASAIMRSVNAEGVIVKVEAEHMCMSMRGIKNVGSKAVTLSAYGELKSNNEYRKEALSLL